MICRTMVALIIAAAVSAAPAWAASWNADQSSAQAAPEAGSSFKPWNVTIKMTQNSGSSPGPCTGSASGFADFCATGSCTCYTFSGTANGTTGKGSMTLYETFDDGTSHNFTGYGCASAYGEIDIDGKKDAGAIAFVGSDCNGLVPSFLTGGCLLGASDEYIRGQGQCSGRYSESVPMTFKIEGKVVK